MSEALPSVAEMSTTALTSWYGSNRMLAEHVGKELDGCAWVLVSFAGGMSEIPHIGARSLLVCDMHSHLINLAMVAADARLGPKLYRQLKRQPFHPVSLTAAQSRCREREATRRDPYTGGGLFAQGDTSRPNMPDLEWALDYFITSWMGRGGRAGRDDEFNGGLSLRWDPNGGDSATRYSSAVSSLVAWRRALARCNFVCGDGFDLIEKAKDEPGHGVYCDPPFPDGGDPYKHKFDMKAHGRLADSLHRFKATRVVIRYYDHPLIRELYPESRWTWVRRVGRKATNAAAPEVLLINGESLA